MWTVEQSAQVLYRRRHWAITFVALLSKFRYRLAVAHPFGDVKLSKYGDNSMGL